VCNASEIVLMAHPLLKRVEKVTEKVSIWTLKQHTHQIIGARRGFEVRIYQDDAWVEPFLVSMTAQDNGYVMDLALVPNAAAAQAAAYEMLAALDGVLPSTNEH
jgi:hypothetical protein